MKLVEGHTPCAACGYDLIGLAESAVCPECASPVAGALKRRSIVSVPRGRAWRWVWGLRLISVFSVVNVVSPVLFVCVSVSGPRAWNWLWTIAGAALLGAVLGFVGFVLLAGRDAVRTLRGAFCVGGFGFALLWIVLAVTVDAWSRVNSTLQPILQLGALLVVPLAMSAQAWGGVGLLRARSEFEGRGWRPDNLDEWSSYGAVVPLVAGGLFVAAVVTGFLGGQILLVGVLIIALPLGTLLGIWMFLGAWHCYRMARAWSAELDS